MVTLYRSANIAPGKTPSALAFARDVATYVSKATGVDVSVAVPVGGNPNRIGFAARYENLGALEAAQLKLAADAHYTEMVSQGADNWIAGSVHDEIWRTL